MFLPVCALDCLPAFYIRAHHVKALAAYQEQLATLQNTNTNLSVWVASLPPELSQLRRCSQKNLTALNWGFLHQSDIFFYAPTRNLHLPCHTTSSESPEPGKTVHITEKHHNLSGVFSKFYQAAPTQTLEYAIDLLLNSSPLKTRIYPLSTPEKHALHYFLISGSLFFVEKREGVWDPVMTTVDLMLGTPGIHCR